MPGRNTPPRSFLFPSKACPQNAITRLAISSARGSALPIFGAAFAAARTSGRPAKSVSRSVTSSGSETIFFSKTSSRTDASESTATEMPVPWMPKLLYLAPLQMSRARSTQPVEIAETNGPGRIST